MCGIAGIIHKNNSSVALHQLETMNNAASHRGPDGEGYYLKNNFGLAHRRLSIIDLSENGKQPLHYLDRYTITFNGEIYNYIELKIELEKSGYQFKTQTDTEVILAAYDYWEQECVNHFNGMWAFAIYDEQENRLFCSRDRFGVKPFYYCISGNQFIFGSEIKQLLTIEKPKVNYKILMDYLVYNLEEHTDETFFNNIKKLPAAHHLTYDLATHQFKIEKYYCIKIDETLKNISEKDAINLFQQNMQRSIQWRLRSDVKVGTCLSGGLDSSYISSIASKFYNHPDEKFSAITAQSISKENDETAFAKQVVEAANLQWFTTQPNRENFLAAIDKEIKCQEEPFFNTSNFMQYFVMKAANQAQIKVLLDGQGGDETILGYKRYYPTLFKSNSVLSFPKIFFQILANGNVSTKELLLQSFYFTNSSFRKIRLKKKHSLIKQEFMELADETWIDKMADAYQNPLSMQLLELQHTQLPRLLKYEDRNSMHFGIETRLPFLDYQLLEFNLSLPTNLKIKNGWSKYILRQSMQNILPNSIAWRKQKVGFESPEKIWLNDDNYFLKTINDSPLLQKIYNNKIPQNNTKHMLWKLFNIAKWEEIFFNFS